MTARLREMSDEQLGGALTGLGVDWPASPELAPRVMAAVREVQRHPRVVRLPRSRRTKILLIAAATVLLLAGAAVAAKIVIDLGAVVVEVNPRPSTLPSPSAPPLGRTVSLEEARTLLGGDVPLPTRLGAPDRLWADRVITESGEAVRISAAWLPRPGLPMIAGTKHGALLMRFEGEADTAFKDVYQDTGVVEPASIGGIEGYWTSGPHLLRLLTSKGMVYLRVDGNVLIWRDGAYTMRLETALPKHAAIRIAASIPPGTT